METIDHLIMADGEAHPAEVKFRAELSSLLEADLAIELVEDAERPHVSVMPSVTLPKSKFEERGSSDGFRHRAGDDGRTFRLASMRRSRGIF